MTIGLMGKCVDATSHISLDYILLKQNKCVFKESYDSVHETSMNKLLDANDNYFQVLNTKLPLFSYEIEEDIPMKLQTQRAFFHTALTCLMKNYDQLGNYFGNKEKANEATFEAANDRVKGILTVFVRFESSFNTQKIIQLVNLILTAVGISLQFLFLIARCFGPKVFSKMCGISELIVEYLINIVVAVIGIYSYLTLKDYLGFVEKLVESVCIDNLTKYYFGVFAESLDETANSNLEIFLITLVKTSILVLSIIALLIARKGKVSMQEFMKVIVESVKLENEDNNDNEDEENKQRKEEDAENKNINEVEPNHFENEREDKEVIPGEKAER